MRIINIDAEQDIAMQCLTYEPFIKDVVRHLDVQLSDPNDKVKPSKDAMNWPIRFFKTPRYENVATLLHTIPIYLRNYDDNADEGGVYHSDVDKYNCYKGPYIELFIGNLKQIDEQINKEHYNGDTFMWLFTKVLIHELAHAAMDIHNCAQYYNVEDKLLSDKEYREYREESMANAIALRIIKDFAGEEKNGFYEFCKNVCLGQDKKYAIGVDFVDFKPEEFTEYVVKEKVEGISEEKRKAWMDKYASK